MIGKKRACACGHEKTQHSRYGSRTLDLPKAYRQCTVCRCMEYHRIKKNKEQQKTVQTLLFHPTEEAN